MSEMTLEQALSIAEGDIGLSTGSPNLTDTALVVLAGATRAMHDRLCGCPWIDTCPEARENAL